MKTIVTFGAEPIKIIATTELEYSEKVERLKSKLKGYTKKKYIVGVFVPPLIKTISQ